MCTYSFKPLVTELNVLDNMSSSKSMANLVASLISLLLAWSSSLEGWPDLGRVLVVPYAFHFLMIVLAVLQRFSSDALRKAFS